MEKDFLLGAWLHDIGKMIGRQLVSQKTRFRHQEIGKSWAEELGLPHLVIEAIKRHHFLKKDDSKWKELSIDAYDGEIKEKNFLAAICEGDNIAAGMEREKSRQELTFDENVSLISVFDQVNLKKEKINPKNSWAPLPLSQAPYICEKGEIKTKNYRELWEGFRQEIEVIKDDLNEENVLLLLQKYASSIPEHTLVRESNPDTSLYHHLKTSAAVAYTNYLYLKTHYEWGSQDLNKEIGDRKEEKYLLVGGDFSGVQDFVYTLTAQGALRTLRGRSFYLSLLEESVVSTILDNLEIPRASVIYMGGGGFFLLAPNTEKARKGLEEIKENYNQYFLKNFGTRLFLALASTPLSGNDLIGKTGELGNKWSDVKGKLGQQKGNKWKEELSDNYQEYFEPRKPSPGSCEACQASLEKEGELCSFCEKIADWGRNIGSVGDFYQVEPGHQKEHCLKCGDNYYTYELNPEDRVIRKYLMKNPWKVEKKGFPQINFFLGTHYTEPSFQDLVEKSRGIKRLGVLRLDVDYLGKIFSQGIPQEKTTFARMNDLSERLNLYFSYYLPRLLAKPRHEALLPGGLGQLQVNLVYSGGDDLFLVGTWDSALNAAWQIYEDFKEFTGDNPSLELSGGIVFSQVKVAFYKLAEMAGREENRSKEEGRGRFSLFGQSYPWDRIKCRNNGSASQLTIGDILEIFGEGIKWNEKGGRPDFFSRGFLQHLIHLSTYYKREEDFWVFPRLHYYFGRLLQGAEQKEREFFRRVLGAILRQDVFKGEAIPAIQILDYLTRGGG